jgi:hypothetical protein
MLVCSLGWRYVSASKHEVVVVQLKKGLGKDCEKLLPGWEEVVV